MKLSKSLLGTSALVAAGLLVSGPAAAFDTVTWTWNKDVTEVVDINVTIATELAPQGLVEIEKYQTQVGNVSANSTVTGVTNNQPVLDGGAAGTASLDLSFSGRFSDETDFDESDGTLGFANFEGSEGGFAIDTATPEGDVEVTAVGVEDIPNDDKNAWNFDATVTFDVSDLELEATGSLDALTELPEVESVATAIGNNQSISSDVAVLLHEGQFLYGGYDSERFDTVTSADGDPGVLDQATAAFAGTAGVAAENLYPGIALALQAGGGLGFITPASITANSSVSEILNASVDSDATAVGNNLSVEVLTADLAAGNNLLIGDLTQFAYANVSATSSVSGVEVNNYTNLNPDVLGRALVSSAATAVGNNVSIKVGTDIGE